MTNISHDDHFDGYDPSAYDRPSVTVDLVLLASTDRRLRALLLRRDQPPQAGRWALPGGFVATDESLDAAAARVLREAGYTGELRAAGDVLVDQLPLMRRCGFDSFAPEAPIDADTLQRSLDRYDYRYQPAADAVVPVWKLRHG